MVGSHRQRTADVALARVLPLGRERAPTTSGPASPRFPGFERMAFSVRTHWDYAWRETGVTNGKADPVKSGVVRIALGNPIELDFGPAGAVRLFETTCSAQSGRVPAWWPQWRYLGVKDGALYAGAELADGEFGAAMLFDAKTGEIHPQGFMGSFSNGVRSIASGTISNSFLTTPAVVVDEPCFDAGCETIGDLQICDGELHDSRVREYYLPGKGFGGWYRRGTSIYAGGGYVDVLEIAMEVGLISTSL